MTPASSRSKSSSAASDPEQLGREQPALVWPAPRHSLLRSQRPRGFYVRLLRLRCIRPTGWQLFLLNEGSLILALLLVLADLATAWSLLVLPLVIAVAVKFTDVVVGALPNEGRPPGPPTD